MNVVENERGEAYKIRLRSKRLSSGKCQVRFEATREKMSAVSTDRADIAYGYYLAEPGATLKEVIGDIRKNLASAGSKEHFYHRNLYQLQRKSLPLTNFILFSC